MNLTAGTHVIFQDLDWVPANHPQAEDRAYRLGQKHRVTVEYMLGVGTLDSFVADLLAVKMKLIGAVEADQVPDASILAGLGAAACSRTGAASREPGQSRQRGRGRPHRGDRCRRPADR